MEVMAITADPVFNYFFSYGAWWAVIASPFFAALSLFEL